jgi:hypothetical protein
VRRGAWPWWESSTVPSSGSQTSQAVPIERDCKLIWEYTCEPGDETSCREVTRIFEGRFGPPIMLKTMVNISELEESGRPRPYTRAGQLWVLDKGPHRWNQGFEYVKEWIIKLARRGQRFSVQGKQITEPSGRRRWGVTPEMCRTDSNYAGPVALNLLRPKYTYER